MKDHLIKFLKKASNRSLNKLTDRVSNKLLEARQKLRATDSSVKSIARTCIDDAEDSYQEAIYSLKEGSTEEAVQYCKKATSYLSLAFLHLSSKKTLSSEPTFVDGETESVILKLGKEIAKFKSVVEYTNCELGKAEHDRFLEVVRIFYRSIDQFANQEEGAKREAFTGLLFMYLLNCQVSESTRSGIVKDSYLDETDSIDASRIAHLINITYEARRAFFDASEPAQVRTNQYLKAAENTIEQSIFEFSQGKEVGKLVKAGKMEVRMAKRLIESSISPEPEKDCEPEDNHSRSYEFKARVAYLQKLIKENDPEKIRLIRRLHQISSYYGLALKLKEEKSYSDAERYARSAHLDIDYARQLFTSGVAFFSETI